MGIRVHAAGSDNFRLTRSALPFGEVMTLGTVLSVVSAGPPHRVAGAAADAVISPGSPHGQATASAGRLGAERAFSIGLAAIYFSNSAPWLFIAARESHVVSPDSGRNMDWTEISRLTLRELTTDIYEVLESANLNSSGALSSLGEVFSRFAARHPTIARPARLMVTLSG